MPPLPAFATNPLSEPGATAAVLESWAAAGAAPTAKAIINPAMHAGSAAIVFISHLVVRSMLNSRPSIGTRHAADAGGRSRSKGADTEPRCDTCHRTTSSRTRS
jgi:hypothetical protein